MHYTEYKLDTDGARVLQGGKPVKLPPEEVFDLLDQDVDELLMPTTLPTPSQIMEYISRAQQLGNYVRRWKRRVMDNIDKWESRVERFQRSVGALESLSGSDGKRYSDTGTMRKDLRTLVTAVWGPTNAEDVRCTTHGIKAGLMPVEKEAALQVARLVVSGDTQNTDEVQEVASSYDDIIDRKNGHKRRLDMMESNLEAKHFDLNNVVKMLELESFEARRPIQVKGD